MRSCLVFKLPRCTAITVIKSYYGLARVQPSDVADYSKDQEILNEWRPPSISIIHHLDMEVSVCVTAADLQESCAPKLESERTEMETFLAFTTNGWSEDSWTDGGAHDGEPLPPPILTPPNPRAGGRASNGPVWVEKLASAAGATLLDFAEIGAVTDKNIWPKTLLPTTSSSANDFVGQETGTDNLYTVAGAIVYTILELTSYPTYAKNIIVVDNYGRGIYETPSGDAFKEGSMPD
ncbi:carbohydrate esterase family protein [Salix suchowensis]|nr:carbohydrate esterase family protein [Salix suchowensis]